MTSIPGDLESSHTPDAIRRRLQGGPGHSFLRDFVYGAIDGSVTTFAVVSGVAGADLPPTVVIVLGFANLVGDGFSMAAGNFLATRAQRQLEERMRRMEQAHISRYPDGEREEVRQIYEHKGFQGDDLERAVNIITSNREQWVDTMLREEHGLAIGGPSPLRAAMATFAAFLLVGLVPLLAFLVPGAASNMPRRFFASTVLTALAFFGIGALKGRFVLERWYTAGLETLAVGGSAALLAYVVGILFRGMS